jgi:hypothetical protein
MVKGPSSPKTIAEPITAPITMSVPIEIDQSIQSWISNIRFMLHGPLTIILVAGLLVAGSFAEICSRKSIEFLDNPIGSIVLFTIPLLLALFLDWATGILAAVISLLLLAKLQKSDLNEGFSDDTYSDDIQTTNIVSNPHRWFVEKILGETPIAISSDRIITSAVESKNGRTSSSSSMSTENTNSGSSSSSHK